MAKYWSGNSRAPWHDYSSRQIYHITLKKSPEAPSFGSLAGDWRLPTGAPGSSYIRATAIGQTIKDCLRKLPETESRIRLFQYALMPDHLHLILSVESPLDDVLGHIIAKFKVMVNKNAGLEAVFDRGFNDQILTTSRDLNIIYKYLRQNPYRLAVRRANPDFFTRYDKLTIGEEQYQVYGNVHLLFNPFKEQVVVHRADSPEQVVDKSNRWLHTAANGGVLVSPFISPKEKEIRTRTEAEGGRIILIVHEAMGERYKPGEHDFELCAEGRMLIVSLGEPSGTPLCREWCLKMNQLAEIITKS